MIIQGVYEDFPRAAQTFGKWRLLNGFNAISGYILNFSMIFFLKLIYLRMGLGSMSTFILNPSLPSFHNCPFSLCIRKFSHPSWNLTNPIASRTRNL